MSKNSRRKFLKGSLSGLGVLGVSPVQQVFMSMVQGIFQEAVAQELGFRAKKLVTYHSSGGPPRWMFDNVLNPNSPSDGIVQNGTVANRFVGGSRYTQTVYQQIRKVYNDREYWLPHMWSLPVAGSAGNVNVDQLLANAMIFRGVDTESNSHSGSRAKMMGRPTDALSLHGAVADMFSDRIFPSADVRAGNAFQYKSQIGSRVDATPRGGNNSLVNLMSAFVPRYSNDASFVAKKRELERSISSSLDAINYSLRQYSPGLEVNQKNARDKILQGLGDLTAGWTQLMGKYNNIITQTALMRHAGIDDRVIGDVVSNRNSGAYNYGGNGRRLTGDDIGEAFRQNPRHNRMAEGFAMIEYVLKNDYAGSVTFLNSGTIGGLQIETSSGNGGSVSSDAHQMGAFISTLGFTKYYLALSACMIELTNMMKSTPSSNGRNLFQDSMIYITGDFGRSPRKDGSGSDHAGDSHSCMVIGGDIRGLNVIGNTYNFKTDRSNSNYTGTYGTAAQVDAIGKQIEMGNIHQTITNMLGVQSLAPLSAESLVKSQGGIWMSAVEHAKMVAR